MPMVYNVESSTPAANYATHGTANTEDAWMVLRQATVNFTLTAINAMGKATAATTLSGYGHFVRLWTTAGSGGTATTPAPTDSRFPASATTAADKVSAITVGTGGGTIKVGVFGHGVSGPGGWVARDEDDKVRVPAGTSDELDIYSICGGTSQPFTGSCRFEE